MTHPGKENVLIHAAAEALTKLVDDRADSQTVESALDWADRSPAHRDAFDQVERVWRVAAAMPRPELPAECRGARRWSLPAAIAAAALLVVCSAVGAWWYWSPRPQPSGLYSSIVGENRTVALDDGTEIILGGASSIVVEYTRHMRYILLPDGEAVFNVAPDSRRPFVVQSAGGQIWAIGTQFDVRRGVEGVTVGVVQGTVQVQSLLAGTQPNVVPGARLDAGHQVRYFANGDIGPVESVPIERMTSWQHGKLVLLDRTLADTVSDLNRYSPQWIVIGSESLKPLRVSGVVMTNDIEDWLRGLEKSLPVKVIARDGMLLLQPHEPIDPIKPTAVSKKIAAKIPK